MLSGLAVSGGFPADVAKHVHQGLVGFPLFPLGSLLGLEPGLERGWGYGFVV